MIEVDSAALTMTDSAETVKVSVAMLVEQSNATLLWPIPPHLLFIAAQDPLKARDLQIYFKPCMEER